MCRCANASDIARSASSSLTASPTPARSRRIGKVISPGRGVRIASQIEPVGGRVGLAARRRPASAPCRRSPPARRCAPGSPAPRPTAPARCPRASPPPPQQTSTSAARDPRLRRVRRDLEPGGALPGDHLRMVVGRDQRQAARRRRSRPRARRGPGSAGRRAPPRRRARGCPRSSPPARPSASGSPPARHAPPPPRRRPGRGCPRRRPAPRAPAPPASSAETAAQAPRALNEPVTCRHSALTQTRRPARLSSAAADRSGVRRTRPRARAAAARMR